jgi:RNA polymerase sigma-70 factor (ECF subfamily)
MADSRVRTDDRLLIDRALRGDEEALGHVLAQDQEWAYNVAYRVLGQDADARDAVQDAFLQTVRALRGDGVPPRTADSFRPWLRRVVSNAALTQVRRRPAIAMSVDEVADFVPGPPHVDPGQAVEHEETRGQVLQALLALPQTQRVALALREYLDASYDDIAEVLDLPRTAIGTLLFRARSGFRVAYDRVTESAPPVDCPDLLPLFASIIDGEPRPAAWLALEQHLRTCAHCQTELEQQRRARRLYALLPILALPAGWDPVKTAIGTAVAGAAGGVGAVTPGAAASPVAPAPLSASPLPADPVATTAAASSAAGHVASSAGAASGGGALGWLAGATGVKAAVATLATAAVVGTAVVAGPFGGADVEPGASASPSPMVLASVASPGPAEIGSPVASPSPAAGAITGVVVTPTGSGAAPSAAASPQTPLATPATATSTVASAAASSTAPGPVIVTPPVASPPALNGLATPAP